jgi:hypothetical protein
VVLLCGSASYGEPDAAIQRASSATRLLICAAAALVTTSCGFLEPKPLDERSEGRRGGIFSGESGTFIVRSGRRPAEESPQDDDRDESPADEGRVTPE